MRPCLDLDLADSDPSTDGIQPECQVIWQTAAPDPTNPMQVLWQENSAPLVQCPAGAGSDGVTADCWYPW